MSVNDILNEIETLHKQEVRKIEEDFQEKSTSISKEENLELKKTEEEVKKEILKKEKQLLEKGDSSAVLTGKNKVLKEKRKLLNNLFDNLSERLKSLNMDESEKLIGSFLDSIEEKEGTLTYGKGQRFLFEEIFKKKNLKYKLSSEGKFEFGFVLDTKDSKYDFSGKNLLQKFKEKNIVKISNKLFSKN